MTPATATPLRAGDRDRAQAAERLSAHAAAGRLTVEELEERLDRAQRAVLVEDLRALEADLPAPAAPERRRPPVRLPRRPSLALLAAACLAAAVLATVLVGHPIAPPLIAAVLLWRAALRPHRPTGRLLP
jgi:hypothetical protein